MALWAVGCGLCLNSSAICSRYLVETYGAEKGFYSCIYPQMKPIIVTALLAAKDLIQNQAQKGYQSFHLFGFDIMVDAEFTARRVRVRERVRVRVRVRFRGQGGVAA